MTQKDIATPFFIVYEDRLRANLALISRVGRESGADIIMAFKANALWRTFPIVQLRQYSRTIGPWPKAGQNSELNPHMDRAVFRNQSRQSGEAIFPGVPPPAWRCGVSCYPRVSCFDPA